MKNLLDYIKESIEVDEAKGSEEENVNVPDSKTFSFNFKDFENAKETLESLQGFESVSVEDEKVTVTVTKDNDADKAFELIQDFIHLRGKDIKRASDEQYAQKVAKCEKTLADWADYVDDLAISGDEPKDNKEGDDKKEDDKKEEE
jgi:hypothetical protein